MKPRRAIHPHAVHEPQRSPLVRPRHIGTTLLQVAGFDGFGLWMLAGLSLAVGVFPDGRGDALVALMLGALLAGAGLLAVALRSRWMPRWHGWTIGRGAPPGDALIALATLLPVLAVGGLARGDNAFWATRLAGALLALCSLASLLITSYGDARRHAPGIDAQLATQLPLSRLVSAAYGGGLWLWLCVAAQVDENDRHALAWIIGLLLLALLRGLIENLRWQAVLPRMPGPRTRFELQPRRYLGALLAYVVPCMALVLASFGQGLVPLALVAAVSCMGGMATELSLYDGALAALPDSR